MPKIRDAASIAEKWSRVTPQRAQDYEDGVRNPSEDWASATASAEDRYKDGVSKAVQRGAFGKGVRNAGTSKWQDGAISKGPQRFSEGVSQSAQRYQDGFAPFAQTIASTNLPPRFPRGDSRNLERARVMAKALRDRKEAGS